MKVSIEGSEIVIRVGVDVLPDAYAGGVSAGYIAPGWRITDAQKFAPELVTALLDEREDGTTELHRLFDKAMDAAIENGAEGCEETTGDAP